MRNMFRQIASLLSQGKDLVLVTVIASSGATPRGAGARMLIADTGRVCGTIGGGAVEYRSEQIAARMLKEKCSGQQDFSLTKDDVQNLGMICGGAVQVYFRFLPAGDRETLALCEKATCKPELLLSTLFEFAKTERPHMIVTRTQMLGEKDGVFYPLEEM